MSNQEQIRSAARIRLGQIDRIVSASLCAPAHNVLFLGPPGIGKTQRIARVCRQFVERYGADRVGFLEINPSNFSALDLGGYPYVPVTQKINSVDLLPITPFAELAKKEAAVIFLDELNTADVQMISAMQRLVQEKRAGLLQLPEATWVFACANRLHETAAGKDIGQALADRFAKFEVDADPDDFVRGFPSYWGVSQTELARKVAPGDPQQKQYVLKIWSAMRSLVAAYIHVNPHILITDPPEDDIDRKIGYPTPRTWDRMSLMVAGDVAFRLNLPPNLKTEELIKQVSEVILKGDKVVETIMSGNIGPEVAYSFYAWVRERDLPNPALILCDPDGVKIPSAPDRVFAMQAALVAHVLSETENILAEPVKTEKDSQTIRKKLADMYERAFTFLERVRETHSGMGDLVEIHGDQIITHIMGQLEKAKLPHVDALAQAFSDVFHTGRFASFIEQSVRMREQIATALSQATRER